MKTVKDLMVPAVECGSVHQDLTVCEAILTFKSAQGEQVSNWGFFKGGALLVRSKDNRVVGKLGGSDIVMNMDPAYRTREDSQAIAHTSTVGLSPALLKSLIQDFAIWGESFEQRCQELLNLKVKDCMCLPGSNVSVLESDLLEVAIHKLATGRHQTLLVTGGNLVVGLLSLIDVFDQLARGCQEEEGLGYTNQ